MMIKHHFYQLPQQRRNDVLQRPLPDVHMKIIERLGCSQANLSQRITESPTHRRHQTIRINENLENDDIRRLRNYKISHLTMKTVALTLQTNALIRQNHWIQTLLCLYASLTI